MLLDVMKREFGFRGYIMTDWSAQHSTMSAAVGLDVRFFLFLFSPSVYSTTILYCLVILHTTLFVTRHPRLLDSMLTDMPL